MNEAKEPKDVFDFDLGADKTVCSNCGSRLIGITPYCPQCGTKLDWVNYWHKRQQRKEDAIILDY